MTVVNNFSAGSSGDILGFIYPAWGSGGTVNGAGMELGLVQADATTPVSTGSAVLGSVLAPGTVIVAAGAAAAASVNVVLDSVATYANASALASALAGNTGHFTLAGTGLAAHDDAHILVAYSNGASVNIGDVEFHNQTSASQSDTAHLAVAASDMVQLTGISLAALAAHNIALIA